MSVRTISVRQSPRVAGRLGAPIFLTAAVLALSSCASVDGTRPKASTSPVGAGLVVALGDGILGPDLGKSLGKDDQLRALEAEYRALEYGAPGAATAWKGRVAGQSGEATPGQPYQVGSQNCRQLVHVVRLSAGETTRRGAACRNADGSWTPLG